ncbi:MAG: riboflavin synthase [Porticoccaceae bacterium]|jgi:riboflavin synthase
MFTGIISAIGKIAELEQRQGDVRVSIRAPELGFDDVRLGDSIACNGVCLTAVELIDQGFIADVSVETLSLTTIENWEVGTGINLEKAMQATDRFGGHIVSGHVDGIGEVVSLHEDARSWRFNIKAPQNLAKYIAQKGSITVDGTSLTVNAINGSELELNIVPHTMLHTIISDYQVGTKVNLEVDLIARYLERLTSSDNHS